MNKFFKYLSLSIVALSLFASIATQCMLIKPEKNKTYSNNAKILSEENTPSKIKPTKSLGYWKDGYLSNWLSFRTLKEANQALNRENWHTQDSARHFFIDRIKKKQNLKSIARIAEQTFTAPEKSLDFQDVPKNLRYNFLQLLLRRLYTDYSLANRRTRNTCCTGLGTYKLGITKPF